MPLPPVTFSTLACPHWSFHEIIIYAQTMGYDGIEWRGGAQGHVHPAAARDQIADLVARMREANLLSLAVTSYTQFVSDNPGERAANVDELKRYLDLAAELDAQFVRVFLGELAPHQTMSDMYPRIIESLEQCLPHAQRVGIGIAIEHHDDFVKTASLVPILTQLDHPNLGAVWDIANAYSAGEMPQEGAQNLRGRIAYVQIKDGVGQHAQWRLTNVGEGEVPLQQALELLQKQNYLGAFSVEWDYAGHPELEPPERALVNALTYVRKLLQQT